ncbi:DNA mismatch repair protein [Mucilaginibacter sp. SG564]|uniref:MutS-related protein n=1 Tax=Mucilaginibacter sp. SG564 TaxID=2587022 RepID=UPI00155309A2|nr:DNA mismatch repair protein [Mucilaginibacter sp. SG564]NOW95065.1 DNA mismatch repair ATPase MutS [Mucilaginibacter sp. SG564]
MNFHTDKQTLDDLNILAKPGSDSIFSLFNNTCTRGGAEILEQYFLYPLTNKEQINNRSQTMQFFSTGRLSFPFKTEDLDSAEIYLSMTDQRTMLSSRENNLAQKFSQLLAADGDYKLIVNGINAIISILQDLNNFINRIRPTAQVTPYHTTLEKIAELLNYPELKILLEVKQTDKPPYARMIAYDDLFRSRFRRQIKQILTDIYQLDVFMSIAIVALKHNFVFAEAIDKSEHILHLSDVFHPLVKNPVTNSIQLGTDKNVVFLTGANMAGKSTLMKSIGIALYLAHLGFPVAAAQMKFSVRDGIYTTINLPDDLGAGNSHFYAEVLRVKKIAKELASSKKLFVIFDELFRGTNVKDAYEGTIAITKAFAEKRSSMFLISTHIVEAGEILKTLCKNIKFVYLPTRMNNNAPVYTYKLESGITADRHGMVIINNERILEIIRSRNNK